ncbi:MAG: biopolymer transporter ExbD [Pontiellaceae bacterium]|nr:biopolymer transporter ExbD [Pontiellaceae bacterium]
MSSLIDVVFLLLIFFIAVAKIIEPEGDIPFSMPSGHENPDVLPMEARIRIHGDDSVSINNGIIFDSEDKTLKGLIDQVLQLKQLAAMQHVPFFVTMDPARETRHVRVVDVMDACASADVRNLTFVKAPE